MYITSIVRWPIVLSGISNCRGLWGFPFILEDFHQVSSAEGLIILVDNKRLDRFLACPFRILYQVHFT